MGTIRSTLCDEIRRIIASHLEELGQYLPSAAQIEDQTPERILVCLERLSEIVTRSPDQASHEQYLEVCECRHELDTFLRRMNQFFDADFAETRIGRMLTQTNRWQQSAARKFQIAVQDVWGLIAPAQPDHLDDLGNGLYEARWWKPVPIMDIEILKYTDGVFVDGEPFEPQTLPGGLALRFSVCVTPEI
jgi:hypothetical protein